MIIRDEVVNLKSNLALWLKSIDFFVFLVDERTSDGSEQVIRDIIGTRASFQIMTYKFDGFGPARTLSLEQAYKFYPLATHVYIADPDWRPEVSTINKADLDNVHDAFRFLIYDRNGQTTRRCDWLLRHRKGLAMRYNLHEVLDIGETYRVKVIDWIVREIEKPGSWHTNVGHGSSMSSKRYKFDLDLLQKDLAIYGHDPHTHYYLGVTHEAYAEHKMKENKVKENVLTRNETLLKEIEYHFNQSEHYLKLRIQSKYVSEFKEERWGCMFMLGSIAIIRVR